MIKAYQQKPRPLLYRIYIFKVSYGSIYTSLVYMERTSLHPHLSNMLLPREMGADIATDPMFIFNIVSEDPHTASVKFSI